MGPAMGIVGVCILTSVLGICCMIAVLFEERKNYKRLREERQENDIGS